MEGPITIHDLEEEEMERMLKEAEKDMLNNPLIEEELEKRGLNIAEIQTGKSQQQQQLELLHVLNESALQTMEIDDYAMEMVDMSLVDNILNGVEMKAPDE